MVNVAASPGQKYDRQLRIWGEHGQANLGCAKVCLLNAGATGSEALKNLVLGGIGEFTAVDGARVGTRDLGNNFLVDAAALGQSRAQVVCNFLKEMNESVVAKFVEEDPDALINDNPHFFADFTLVIATQMSESSLVKLDDICRGFQCQLIIARSYGLMGLVRISGPEHCVVESKPDTALDDLRLHKPWPELLECVEAHDLDIDDPAIHSHVPFVIILLKALLQWNAKLTSATSAPATSGLRVPKTPQEKAAFKEVILSHRKALDEENYKEAMAAAFKVWAPPSIGPELQQILEDKAAEVSSGSSDFWIMVAALKGFIENEGAGEVPLEGSIPDMHSYTQSYVALQTAYKAKADADVAAVENRVHQIAKAVRGKEASSVSHDSVKQFCRNARNLRVLRYKALREEMEGRGAARELFRSPTGSEDHSHAVGLYLLLRAADRFVERYKRCPGCLGREVEEEDVSKMKSLVQSFITPEGASPGGKASDGVGLEAVGDDLISEFCRFGGSEIHCVGAVIGGIASQEAIKMITRQFTPLAGTFIYNAISSTSAVLNL